MAKYEALILGLKVEIEIGVTHLHIYGDSQLIVIKVNEIYNTKDEKLITYKNIISKLLVCFEEYQLKNIPRNNNKLVDAMASAALLISIEVEGREATFIIKNLETPSIVEENSKMVCVAQKVGYEVNPWYQHIFKYLRDNFMDPMLDKKEQIRMKRLATKYVIIGDILYKRSFNGILLRFLHDEEIGAALEHTHGGACEGHFNGRLVYGKLIRMGYW